jgi:short-subunit dehydrogenase
VKVLAGRTALLTGASGGLGGYLARALGAEGVRLLLSGRDEAKLEALAASIGPAAPEPAVLAADLAEPGAVADLADRATAAGPVDVLVNNAGIELVEPFERSCDKDLEQIVAVNLQAPISLTRLLAPGMLERREGHVVNVASLAGRLPPAYSAAYAATKAGLIAFTHSLRGEFYGRPVGFSVICPGFVDGDGMYARLREEGLPAPATVGTVPPDKVTGAVLDALRHDRPETLVGRRSLRLLVAAGFAAPELGERMLAASGIHDYFRRVAG